MLRAAQILIGVAFAVTGSFADLPATGPVGWLLFSVYVAVAGVGLPWAAAAYVLASAISGLPSTTLALYVALGSFGVSWLARRQWVTHHWDMFWYGRRLRRGDQGRPGIAPEPSVLIATYGYWLVVALPLVTAIAVVLTTGRTPVLIAAGAAATAVAWGAAWRARPFSRYPRRSLLFTEAQVHLLWVLMMLNNGSVFARSTQVWVVLAPFILAAQIALTWRLRRTGSRSALSVTQSLGPVLNGQALFYAVLGYPLRHEVELLWTSVAFASVGLVAVAVQVRSPWWARLSDTSVFQPRTADGARARGAWLYAPDPAVPHALAARARKELTAAGWPPSRQAVRTAQVWLDVAKQLVDSAPALVAARGDCLFTQGQISEVHTHRGAALAAYRAAAAAFTEADLPALAALARLAEARLVPDPAPVRAAIAANDALPPAVRRLAGADLPGPLGPLPPVHPLADPPWNPLPEHAPRDAPDQLAVFRAGEGHARRLITRGERLWRGGDHARAATELRAAATLLADNAQLAPATSVLLELGRAQADRDPVAAHDTFQAALALRSQFADNLVDEPLRIQVNGWFDDPHSRLIALLARDQEVRWPATAAFDLAERARSRLLLELLGDSTPLAARGVPPELAARERRHLEQVRRSASAARKPGERTRNLALLRAARAELAETWRAMAEHGGRAAEYAALRRGEPAGFAEIAATLHDATLAEYHVTVDEVVLFLARSGDSAPRVVRVPMTRDELVGIVAEFGETAREIGDGDPDRWRVPLVPLVAPLVEACAEGAVIWIVPHDLLHGLPLHAVEVDGRPLGARNPVCYTASATVMRYSQARRRPDATGTVVLADSRADQPLPRSRAHAQRLGARTCLVGDEATVPALADAMGTGVSVLHIACHGEFDHEQPVRSRVLLAASGADDGLLTAERILGMSLPADLVTLSACQSGLADRRPGDELFGLTRALVYAGAASVLVSLWSVDELPTTILMAAFYRARADGAGKAEALRIAQTAVREATAADVLAHCERTGMPARDIADTRFRAGDFAGALREYTALLATDDSPDLLIAHAACTLAAGVGGTPDYSRRIYAPPANWAAFVLIGDWR
ncbi:CHAT domain-containing protein [Actinokineospora diospyrosa]|uniref:CHAT domain-containing protein n=1 Tax=Actinokineospora diospyrosa TaxID=103728 RepID=A0ABT1I619_9PSEU|nr:CHAT domain-containing protein [Actinokineospora diospyrosa]MCP2268070.1 CHAT domain-containing protein [Actinokineospora diospyrosa]